MDKKIVIIGSGVVGIHAATKLLDGGYPGNLITIIDAGKDPYERPETELMKGFAGCGMKSDGKYTRSTEVGGQLSKYVGEEKAYELMDETIEMLKRFHPDPSKIIKSEPIEEPDFIKPYFNLRLFPVWHVGSDYLDTTSKNWYNWLVKKGINFKFDEEVKDINFEYQRLLTNHPFRNDSYYTFDKLIYATGKSGIDFTQQLIKKYDLPKESKSTQIGVRFESPQKYFQKLVDLAYDFKLYQKPNDKVSIRTFCTNNDKAYVAVEETYGDISFNGHAKKDEKYRNDMTNFGILMEIKGIENPFEWAREAVGKCQEYNEETFEKTGEGLYYSPNQTRKPGLTSEGTVVKAKQIDSTWYLENAIGKEYSDYITNFISDMSKVFDFKDDWGIYIPEVKYLSEEVIVNYTNLALADYPNVHFAGDSLSARGIVISASHGILIAEELLKELK